MRVFRLKVLSRKDRRWLKKKLAKGDELAQQVENAMFTLKTTNDATILLRRLAREWNEL